MAFRSVN